jgi:homoserine kinase type II
MALFRSLSLAEVNEILADYELPPAVACAPIAVGTINTNVRVQTADGLRFLRINEGKSLEDVRREAAIVSHLAARGVPTPAPLRARDGQPFTRWRGQLVSLFPWLPGRTLSRADLVPAHAAEVGRALAALHLAGADYPDHSPGRYEPAEIDRRLATVAALATAARSDLQDAIKILGPELAALPADRHRDLPMGIIHADLFIDNVMYEGDGLAALIDFEQAAWGRLTYDLAVTTLAFGYGRDDFRPEIVTALLAAYAAVRSPTAAERAAFPAELRFAACRFAVTRITDVYLRRSEGAAPGKDYRRYLARLQTIKTLLAAGPDPILTLP